MATSGFAMWMAIGTRARTQNFQSIRPAAAVIGWTLPAARSVMRFFFETAASSAKPVAPARHLPATSIPRPHRGSISTLCLARASPKNEWGENSTQGTARQAHQVTCSNRRAANRKISKIDRDSRMYDPLLVEELLRSAKCEHSIVPNVRMNIETASTIEPKADEVRRTNIVARQGQRNDCKNTLFGSGFITRIQIDRSPTLSRPANALSLPEAEYQSASNLWANRD